MASVGIVSIQGDFDKHSLAVERCGFRPLEVRSPEDLAQVDRVILPGGESTTVGLLMKRFGLGDALIKASNDGMPIWGTCMGMIMLATNIEGQSDQYSLGLLDIEVRRNAFGAQIHSFEDDVLIPELKAHVTAVFIRAPIVTRVGTGVEVVASYGDAVVAVRSGKTLGTSFHPELTDDLTLHKWFLSW